MQEPLSIGADGLLSVRELMVALYHNLLSGKQASLDHGLVADFRSGLHETLLSHAVIPQDKYIRPALLYHQSLGRDGHCVLADIQKQCHICELSREKLSVGIRDLGTDCKCPGLGIHLRICEIHQSPVFIYTLVRQCDSHIRIP